MNYGMTRLQNQNPPDDKSSNQVPGSPYPNTPPPVRVNLQFEAKNARVTFFIVGMTVAVFLLQVLSGMFYGTDYPADMGAKSNTLILQGQLWRLFTPLLLHGSITHIFFNMYALISLGRGLEMYYGHKRFLLLYLISGFAGNVFSFLLTSNPSYGASTAIFGLVAAEGVFIYQNRKYFKNPRGMLVNIFVIIGINILIGQAIPMIDQFGHLGGLLGGFAFAWLAGPIWHQQGLGTDILIEDSRKENPVFPVVLGVGLLFAMGAAAKFFFMK
jgi:rhomboid protease GluP